MPLVSVILLVWNNTEHLLKCLAFLQEQTYEDFEIILLDNGSLDLTYLNRMSEKYAGMAITVEKLATNRGFAAANNIGARLARGKWLALLNADAFSEPDWLEKLLHAAKGNPEYIFFASRQIQATSPDLLDGVGDAYHITGLAWRRHYNQLERAYGHQTVEVFSACPTAALYSREEFLKVGGFDEDYFSYFEDVDLGFRLRLNGGKCLYVPDAVVHHVGSASTGKRSDFSVYYGYRNMIWTYVKNMPSPYFWLFLPLHISAVFFFALHYTLRGQGGAIWRAIFDAIRGLPKTLAKRKTIQKNMKIKPREALLFMSTGLLEPYREFMKRNRPA
jgi:GT2 family glycosyltransferase